MAVQPCRENCSSAPVAWGAPQAREAVARDGSSGSGNGAVCEPKSALRDLDGWVTRLHLERQSAGGSVIMALLHCQGAKKVRRNICLHIGDPVHAHQVWGDPGIQHCDQTGEDMTMKSLSCVPPKKETH